MYILFGSRVLTNRLLAPLCRSDRFHGQEGRLCVGTLTRIGMTLIMDRHACVMELNTDVIEETPDYSFDLSVKQYENIFGTM